MIGHRGVCDAISLWVLSTMAIEFEWDANKAGINLSKHRVSFDEAKTVFNDPLFIDFYDPDHSDNDNATIFL